MNKSCSVLKQFLRAHCCLIITSAKPHPDPESSTPVTKATTASKYFLAVNKYFCEQTAAVAEGFPTQTDLNIVSIVPLRHYTA